MLLQRLQECARWGFILGLAVACPRSASAEPDTLLAESLYQSGKQLFDQGSFAEACPKLAQSQRLDPAGGTALLLATCWEKVGRVASSVIAYQDALSFARRDRRADREKLASERLKALEPEVPRLTVRLSKGALAAASLEVKRDGEVMIREAFGVELLVDPGNHVLRASAPGYAPFEASFQIALRERKSVEIPALTPRPEATASASAPPPPPPPAASSSAPAPEPPPAVAPASLDRRTIGLLVGGAGVVIMGVGGYFGLHAISQRDEIEARCPERRCSDRDIVDRNDSALRDANLANVLLPLGLVTAGAGAFLFFTAPDRPSGPTTSTRWAPALAPGLAGFSMRGSF